MSLQNSPCCRLIFAWSSISTNLHSFQGFLTLVWTESICFFRFHSFVALYSQFTQITSILHMFGCFLVLNDSTSLAAQTVTLSSKGASNEWDWGNETYSLNSCCWFDVPSKGMAVVLMEFNSISWSPGFSCCWLYVLPRGITEAELEMLTEARLVFN